MSSQFVGKYVKEMAEVHRASALSGVNCYVVGAEPGTGKTDISLASAYSMFGQDHVLFLRIDPSTDPMVVKKRYDPQALITTGELKMIADGSPYDSRLIAWVIDEIARANDPMFDALLATLDMKSWPHQIKPVAFATGNWIPKSERTRAMIDRFGMYYVVPNEAIEVQKFVAATLGGMMDERKTVDFDYPSFDEIVETRKARPTPGVVELIGDFLADFREEIQQGLRVTDANGNVVVKRQFRAPNRRRLEMWEVILFRVSYYLYQDDDFTDVHPDAYKMLAYSWRADTPEELNDWRDLVLATASDPIQAALERLIKQAYNSMTQIANAGASAPPARIMQELMAEVQKNLDDAKELIENAGRDDAMVEQVQNDLQGAIAKLLRGEAII